MNNLPPPSFLSGYGAVMIGNFAGNAIEQQDYKVQDVHYLSGAIFAYGWNWLSQSGYLPSMFTGPMAFYGTALATGIAWGFTKPTVV